MRPSQGSQGLRLAQPRVVVVILVLAATLIGYGVGARASWGASREVVSAETISYADFKQLVRQVQEEFHPTGFRLIYPTDSLNAELIGLPELTVDARDHDGVDGDPLKPGRYDLYYYGEADVLVQVSLIYDPHSDRERLVYYSALRDDLVRPHIPEEAQEKAAIPYVLQGLIAQQGYLVRFTALSVDSSLSEEETLRRVGLMHDQFAPELDQFLAELKP